MAEKTSKLNTPNPQLPCKSVVEAPFTLRWPNIPQHLVEIVEEELKKSTSGLKKEKVKLRWKEVQQFKKGERIEGRKKLIANHVENMTEEDRMQYQIKMDQAQEGWSHLDHGYNSVMRNLLKEELAAVLIKMNVIPDMLGLSFLPVCFTKNIPLIPIDNLDGILKNENSLGVSHSIIVLGLKKSIKVKDCRFNNLLEKITVAWNSRTTDCIFSEAQENVGTKASMTEIFQRRKKSVVSQHKVDVSKFLLRRPNKRTRVFVPESSDSKTGDFIKIVELGGDLETVERAAQIKTDTENVPENDKVSKTTIDVSSLACNDLFSLEDSAPEKKKRYKKNTKGIKRKLSSQYLPPVVSKIKPNPNKKKKVAN